MTMVSVIHMGTYAISSHLFYQLIHVDAELMEEKDIFLRICADTVAVYPANQFFTRGGGGLDPKLGRHVRRTKKLLGLISAEFVGNFGKTDPY